MTTREPGASEVFTHGFGARPRCAAFFASRAAAIITSGLEVLVQEVIAAITTAPWPSSTLWPPEGVAVTGWCGRRGGPAAPAKLAGLSPSRLPVTAIGSEAGNDSAPLASSPTGGGPAGAYRPRTARNACCALASGIRSCGRFGPAIDGVTADRSRSRTWE